MSMRVLSPRGRALAPRHYTPRAAPKRAGAAGPVTVQVDPALGDPGQQLAAAVLAAAAADHQRVAALFGAANPPPVVVSIEQLSQGGDGTGGAWHQTCDDAMLHCDADLHNWQRTAALWIAEFVEVLSAAQIEGGWDCGNTNGEGISRVVAEWAYPGALDDYSTASVWLDGARPNFVDVQYGNDTDPESNGCAVLYLWWLVSLGYDLAAICQAPGSTLAATGQQLAGDAASWEAFSAAVAAAWPAGQPSGVQTDNPWPDAGGGGGGGGGNGGGGGGGGPAQGIALTLAGDAAAGDYLLVPVPQLRHLGGARLSAEQIDEAVQIVAALLRLFLGGKGGTGSAS